MWSFVGNHPVCSVFLAAIAGSTIVNLFESWLGGQAVKEKVNQLWIERNSQVALDEIRYHLVGIAPPQKDKD